MIDKSKIPQAYKEVYEILKYIPDEDYKKIPQNIISKIESGKDDSYNFEVTEFEDFQKQKMLKETEAILAIFYRDYWATERERNIIINHEEQDRINSYKINFENNCRKNREENIVNSETDNEKILTNQKSMIVVKEGVFKKLIKRIKHWFMTLK